MTIENLEIDSAGLLFSVTDSSIDIDRGDIILAMHVGQPPVISNGPIQLDIGVTGRLEQFDPIRPEATMLTADIRIDGVRNISGEEEAWEIGLRLDEIGLNLLGGPNDAITGFFGRDGRFRFGLTEPLPIRLNIEGLIDDEEIEMDILDIDVDASGLQRLLALGILRFTDGRLEGALRLAGPLNDPNFYGTVYATDVSAWLDFVPDQLESPGGSLVFEGKQFRIYPFRAYSVDSSATVEVDIALSQWIPRNVQVSIETPQEDDRIHVAYNFNRLVVDGFTQGSLLVGIQLDVSDVTKNRLNIDGTINVPEGTLSIIPRDQLVPDQLGTVVQRRQEVRLDLDFTSGYRVAFLWPSGDFPIIRAVASEGEQLHLTTGDVSYTFDLEGDIALRSGDIFYFDRSFYIREGSIIFKENERGFDPIISARSEIRELSDTGPVSVFLVIDEGRLSNLVPQLQSNPPLTSREIAAVLSGNIYDDRSSGLSNTLRISGDLITRFTIINDLERNLRETLGLDILSLRTQIFQNILLERLNLERDSSTDSLASLDSYLNNTSLFIGKYLGPNLFLQTLVSLRAADPIAGSTATQPLEFSAEVGLEMQTPLFLLQWRVFPQDIQTLFLLDNTFSLLWDVTY